ncbi:hypothetical protein [Paenibacillus lautus]|uniref:hypothetical protein n=1 Tax=Paenibacillus lautus TaxID=1401 RepID=UPI003D2B80A3
MEKLADKQEVRQPGMNPWKKKLLRTIYKHDGHHYISGSHCYQPAVINGKEYTEVKQVLGYWFIK